MAKVRKTTYLHSNKEDMYDIGQSLGLTGSALDQFMYALYEVEFDLEVDTVTGDYTIKNVKE